jgi:hypothetical protein
MKAANYAILEANLAILCISLPMLQPFVRGMCAYLKQRFPHSSSEHANNYSSYPSSGWRRIFKFRSKQLAGDRGANGNGNGNHTIGIGKSVTFGVVRSVNNFPAATSSTHPFSDAYRKVQEGQLNGYGDDDDNRGTSGRQSRSQSRNKSRSRDKGLVSRVRSLWASRRVSDDTVELTPANMGMGITTTITGGMR